MDDRHDDLRQLNMLMGIIGLLVPERMATTGTGEGFNLSGLSRGQQLLAVPFSFFSLCAPCFFGSILLVGRVGRGWPVGIGGVFVQPGLKFFDRLDQGRQKFQHRLRSIGQVLFGNLASFWEEPFIEH